MSLCKSLCWTLNNKLPKFKEYSTSTQYANTNNQDNNQNYFENVIITLQQSTPRDIMDSNYSFLNECEDA